MYKTSDTYKDRYDLGLTAVHEAGHWFALAHTFDGGCNAHGDFVADTPAMKVPTSGCPPDATKDTCPNDAGFDPIHNYMDYSYDQCYTEFTQRQARPGRTTSGSSSAPDRPAWRRCVATTCPKLWPRRRRVAWSAKWVAGRCRPAVTIAGNVVIGRGRGARREGRAEPCTRLLRGCCRLSSPRTWPDAPAHPAARSAGHTDQGDPTVRLHDDSFAPSRPVQRGKRKFDDDDETFARAGTAGSWRSSRTSPTRGPAGPPGTSPRPPRRARGRTRTGSSPSWPRSTPSSAS